MVPVHLLPRKQFRKNTQEIVILKRSLGDQQQILVYRKCLPEKNDPFFHCGPEKDIYSGRERKDQHEAQLINYALSGFHESLNQKEKEKVLIITSSALVACHYRTSPCCLTHSLKIVICKHTNYSPTKIRVLDFILHLNLLQSIHTFCCANCHRP